MRALVGERDVRAARAVAGALEEQMNHRRTAVLGLALRSGSDQNPDDLRTILQESDYLLGDFDKGLAFFRPDEGLLAYQGDEVFWEASRDKDILNQIIAASRDSSDSPTSFVSISDPVDNLPVIVVIASPRADGVIGAGAFTPAHMLRVALGDALISSERGYVFVVDQEGRLLFRMGTEISLGEVAASHPGVLEALRGESGSTYIQVGAGEHVVAYSPISPFGWALVVEEPWEAVTSPLLRATEYAPLVLIPILILALVTLWFGTRLIIQPLRSLEGKASALGWGQFEAIEEPVGGIAEIRHLQTELISLAGKVKAAQQGLRGYIGVMTRGLEEERRRLARELHDDTLQSLIALNQRIQLTKLSLNGGAALNSLDEIQSITENTIRDLRRVTSALRPIYLEDLGLVAALEMLARETQQLHELEIHFERRGAERRLSPEVELALYRMVQEELSNVVRHANASKASVLISFSKDHVKVDVKDNGRGFEVPESPSAFAPRGHYGLLGLFERAELIRAEFSITSRLDQGTHITITVPLGAENRFQPQPNPTDEQV